MLRRASSRLRTGPRILLSVGLLVALGLLVGPTQQVSTEVQGAEANPVSPEAGPSMPGADSADLETVSSDAAVARSDPASMEEDASGESETESGAISEPAPLFWEVSGDSPYRFDYPVGDYRPERHALRLAPSVAAGLGVGDRISLPVPGLGTLVATVEHVETTPLGSRGISGSIEGLDDAYAITLTQGHASFFGRITTPSGNYMIEGTGGAASIFKDDLDHLIDPDSVDEVYPPESAEEQV